MSYYRKEKSTSEKIATGAMVVGGLGLAGAVALYATRYRVCKPNQYLVRTGFGIDKMKVSKRGLVLPIIQKGAFVDMNPITYRLKLHNMSKGKVEFELPVVFTIGPKDPDVDIEGFINYAKLITDNKPEEVCEIISGLVEGEARGLTSTLTVEEIFEAKDQFKEDVVGRIQTDMDALGLYIYNANIKEMNDYDEQNKYFEYRKQRAIQTANYEAQVDVANAKKKGEIGVKQLEKDERSVVAENEAIAISNENLQQEKIATSKAQLAEVQAVADRRKEVAKIEARANAELREADLQKEVELYRQQQQLQHLRADELMKTTVGKECTVEQADGEAKAIRLIADANLYKAERTADGILADLQARATGLHEIVIASDGDTSLAKFYLARDELLPELAKYQSEAVQGMEPKIHVWNTGSDAGEKNPLQPVMKSIQSFAPLINGLADQTDLGKVIDRFTGNLSAPGDKKKSTKFPIV